MPRAAHYQLQWSSQKQIYELYAGGRASECAFTTDWLETIASFSFRARSGVHFTVRKQMVQRGGMYWYGYRRLQGRIVKRYLGRTADLSIARLEEMARFFSGEQQEMAQYSSEQSRERKEETSTQVPHESRSMHTLQPSVAAPLPLLLSRLSPPRLPVSLMERPHLQARLDSSLLHTLILLQAPAGFGKTTLITRWINKRRSFPTPSPFPAVSWLSLDADDNDLHRFWRMLIMACQSLQRDVGQTALVQLSEAVLPPFDPPPLEIVLTHLLNDLAQQVSDGLLVLDDYHVITEPRIHETLTFFLDRLPTTLRVLLLTRSEPPLPLLRWRARGNLYELHGADLRFSSEETASFLHQALPTSLSDAHLTQLDTLLGGWAAGLRLLSLALQDQRSAQEVEHTLLSLGDSSSPSHVYQSLLDYFVSEILQAQPEALQRFLLQTSVLGRLNGPLCDAVTGGEHSSALLEAAERAGLFLEALDGSGTWYRFHALFSEAMLREARYRLGEAALQELSLRASYWYEQHGMMAEAIEEALLARDPERAALLIEQSDPDRQHSELSTLRRWFSQIPDAVLSTHPMLCWLSALTLRFQEQEAPVSEATARRIDVLLQMAEDGWSYQNELPWIGLISAFRAMSAWKQGQISQATEHAQQALTILPNDVQDRHIRMMRGICLFVVGVGCMYEGRFGEARSLLQNAYLCSLVGNNSHFTRSMLLLVGVCCNVLSELHQAYEYYQQVLLDARQQQDYEVAAQALLGLASIAFEWNDLAATESQINEALEMAQHQDQDLRDRATLQLALLSHARGQITIAQQQLAALLARLQVGTTFQATHMLLDVLVWQARLFLEAGDLQNALRCVETLDLEKHTSARIFQARLLLAQDSPHEARRLLEPLLPVVQEWRQVRESLEVQVLLAQACLASQQVQQARQWLIQVLSQARSEGFIRLFLSEGELLARLLRHTVLSLQEPALYDYALTILQAFTPANGEHDAASFEDGLLLEPLSLQEQRVLRLLVAGRSNLEIAQELVVSINTVKDHVKHLYRKLGVNNRLQASKVARRLKLFDLS